ncbi:dnj-23 [Pristionchus pacificus]|uniref:Dnj-23 n=1 Tax=Pristionchus pacificus TaxID=54126 RepID=A0A454XZD0_PRIPA|nr:dnj-23 [Pristionchus pacificus]|eukprot:PDM82331.1 dnj-23 [Pristionchus pacificus]
MGLLDDCESHFGTRNLYEILHVEKDIDAKKLKKAYYTQSLKWHPDRFSSDDADETKKEVATEKFQILSRAYEILNDKGSRALYDETGSVGDDGEGMSEEDFERCVKMWRGQFKKVTKEDIDAFFTTYTGSEEEKSDVKAAYEKCKGDMDKIVEHVPSEDNDEERLVSIIKELIEEGELKETKKFKTSSAPAKVEARKRKAVEEAKEAEKELKKIKQKEGDGDLAALILRRQGERANQATSFLAGLEEKYGGGGAKKGAKKAKK